MNLMNFIYENYMKFTYLFDLREHDIISSQQKNTNNKLYVSFDHFNLNYIVSSSQIPDYTIELDKFATESKEIYEMALKIKQNINQYNEILTLFCVDNGKWKRSSIDDFRNILERISKDTFLSSFELYNYLHIKVGFISKLEKLYGIILPERKTKTHNCEYDFLTFKESRERQLCERLNTKEYSADSMWIESRSLTLLRAFMCVPYTFEESREREMRKLLYHTLLYSQLSIGSNDKVYSGLISDVTKTWIKNPEPYTHFFVCDYITTIEEFLTYSSINSKFANCKLRHILELKEGNLYVGTKDLNEFFVDIRRLNVSFQTMSGQNIDKDNIPSVDSNSEITGTYIKFQKREDVLNYTQRVNGNYAHHHHFPRPLD